jgi:hypothetical protein
LQHPAIFPVCVACLCADAEDFFIIIRKNILFGKLSFKEKKKTLVRLHTSFFIARKLSIQNVFCLRMKNHQHQHRGKPHTKEKSQCSEISMEDAVIMIRSLNL